ncbi:uncharacterized protein LOC144872438 isoform X2 [Branchiostoma floridae x Branchiostoma japonicum]
MSGTKEVRRDASKKHDGMRGENTTPPINTDNSGKASPQPPIDDPDPRSVTNVSQPGQAEQIRQTYTKEAVDSHTNKDLGEDEEETEEEESELGRLLREFEKDLQRVESQVQALDDWLSDEDEEEAEEEKAEVDILVGEADMDLQRAVQAEAQQGAAQMETRMVHQVQAEAQQGAAHMDTTMVHQVQAEAQQGAAHLDTAMVHQVQAEAQQGAARMDTAMVHQVQAEAQQGAARMDTAMVHQVQAEAQQGASHMDTAMVYQVLDEMERINKNHLEQSDQETDVLQYFPSFYGTKEEQLQERLQEELDQMEFLKNEALCQLKEEMEKNQKLQEQLDSVSGVVNELNDSLHQTTRTLESQQAAHWEAEDQLKKKLRESQEKLDCTNKGIYSADERLCTMDVIMNLQMKELSEQGAYLEALRRKYINLREEHNKMININSRKADISIQELQAALQHAYSYLRPKNSTPPGHRTIAVTKPSIVSFDPSSEHRLAVLAPEVFSLEPPSSQCQLDHVTSLKLQPTRCNGGGDLELDAFEVVRLESELVAERLLLEDLTHANKSLKEDLDKVQKKYSTTRADLLNKDNEIKDLHTQLEYLKDNLDTAQLKITEQTDIAEKLQMEKEALLAEQKQVTEETNNAATWLKKANKKLLVEQKHFNKYLSGHHVNTPKPHTAVPPQITRCPKHSADGDNLDTDEFGRISLESRLIAERLENATKDHRIMELKTQLVGALHQTQLAADLKKENTTLAQQKQRYFCLLLELREKVLEMQKELNRQDKHNLKRRKAEATEATKTKRELEEMSQDKATLIEELNAANQSLSRRALEIEALKSRLAILEGGGFWVPCKCEDIELSGIDPEQEATLKRKLEALKTELTRMKNSKEEMQLRLEQVKRLSEQLLKNADSRSPPSTDGPVDQPADPATPVPRPVLRVYQPDGSPFDIDASLYQTETALPAGITYT